MAELVLKFKAGSDGQDPVGGNTCDPLRLCLCNPTLTVDGSGLVVTEAPTSVEHSHGYYVYTFEYDESQVTQPITACDIKAAQCYDCFAQAGGSGGSTGGGGGSDTDTNDVFVLALGPTGTTIDLTGTTLAGTSYPAGSVDVKPIIESCLADPITYDIVPNPFDPRLCDWVVDGTVIFSFVCDPGTSVDTDTTLDVRPGTEPNTYDVVAIDVIAGTESIVSTFPCAVDTDTNTQYIITDVLDAGGLPTGECQLVDIATGLPPAGSIPFPCGAAQSTEVTIVTGDGANGVPEDFCQQAVNGVLVGQPFPCPPVRQLSCVVRDCHTWFVQEDDQGTEIISWPVGGKKVESAGHALGAAGVEGFFTVDAAGAYQLASTTSEDTAADGAFLVIDADSFWTFDNYCLSSDLPAGAEAFLAPDGTVVEEADLPADVELKQHLGTVDANGCLRFKCRLPFACVEDALCCGSAIELDPAADADLLAALQDQHDGLSSECIVVGGDASTGSGYTDQTIAEVHCNPFIASPVVDDTGTVIGFTVNKQPDCKGPDQHGLPADTNWVLAPQSQIDAGVAVPGELVDATSLEIGDVALYIGSTDVDGCLHFNIGGKSFFLGDGSEPPPPGLVFQETFKGDPTDAPIDSYSSAQNLDQLEVIEVGDTCVAINSFDCAAPASSNIQGKQCFGTASGVCRHARVCWYRVWENITMDCGPGSSEGHLETNNTATGGTISWYIWFFTGEINFNENQLPSGANNLTGYVPVSGQPIKITMEYAPSSGVGVADGIKHFVVEEVGYDKAVSATVYDSGFDNAYETHPTGTTFTPTDFDTVRVIGIRTDGCWTCTDPTQPAYAGSFCPEIYCFD